jgi:hypothetical protein
MGLLKRHAALAIRLEAIIVDELVVIFSPDSFVRVCAAEMRRRREVKRCE